MAKQISTAEDRKKPYGGGSVVNREVDRFLDGKPVIEADFRLVVNVDEDDVKSAIPKDPQNCAVANAVKRTFASGFAFILKRVVYFELPNEDGDSGVYRFEVTAKQRARLEHFDRTGEFPSGGFVFKPPRPSMRLDYQRKQDRKRIRRGGSRGPRNSMFLDTRNGSGLVHSQIFTRPQE